MVPVKAPIAVDTWTYTAKYQTMVDCGCLIKSGDIVHVTRYANLRYSHCPKCYKLYGNPQAKVYTPCS